MNEEYFKSALLESRKPVKVPLTRSGLANSKDCIHDYVVRSDLNPIITRYDLPFRAQCVFNSGAVLHNDRIVMLLNVWDAEFGPRFVVAQSDDGVHFEISDQELTPHMPEYFFWDFKGYFDIRITPLQGEYYITYNTYSDASGGRIRLAKTRDFSALEDIGFITGADHRNCVLFPEKIDDMYVRLERPGGQNGLGEIFISYSPDLIHWGETKLLLKKGTRYWESCKIGPGAPPIRTEQGWLVLYHGCREHMNGIMYSMGAMLLDLEDPSKILGKMRECLMWPEKSYEFFGNVPGVVFPTASIVHGEPDELKIYYGAADTAMAMGRAKLSQIISKCLEDGPVTYRLKG